MPAKIHFIGGEAPLFVTGAYDGVVAAMANSDPWVVVQLANERGATVYKAAVAYIEEASEEVTFAAD